MNEAEGPPAGTPENDSYRAGWLAGHAARQLEVDELETLADRYYTGRRLMMSAGSRGRSSVTRSSSNAGA